MSHAIQVDALTVTRGERAVLDALNLTVEAGERVVLTGANGAGKSTLLNAIAGTLRSDCVRLHSASNRLPTARQQLGWCPGGARLPDVWTPRELLVLRQLQLPVPSTQDPLGITPLLDTPVRHLSAGERQRVALSLALSGPPTIALLDEPLEHLDAEGRTATLNAIDALPNTTLVIATHRPDDWAAIATRTLHLRNGRLEEA